MGPLEERRDRRQRNLELADGDIALRQLRIRDVISADQRIAAGNDDDRVVRLRHRDDGGAGMRLGRLADGAEIDALIAEERPQLSPERILAQPADQRGLGTEPRRGDRLVRTLAARKIKHLPAGDGLADLGMAIGRGHHIHVDAAGDEDAPHETLYEVTPLAESQTLTSNSCLTLAMSTRVGRPASLPRRWILKVEAARAKSKCSRQLLPGWAR